MIYDGVNIFANMILLMFHVPEINQNSSLYSGFFVDVVLCVRDTEYPCHRYRFGRLVYDICIVA